MGRQQKVKQERLAEREKEAADERRVELFTRMNELLDKARNEGKDDLIRVMLAGLTESSGDPFTSGWIAGWNAAIDVIHGRFEPLMQRQIEAQHKVGYLEGVIARDEGKIPAAIVEQTANLLGHDLAELDTLDRAFCAPFGVERYINQAPVHELRAAALDAAQGKKGAADRLHDLLRDNPIKAGFADMMGAMKQRARGRMSETDVLGKTIKRIREDAQRRGEKITLERAALMAMEEMGKPGYCTAASAIRHYYRVTEGKS